MIGNIFFALQQIVVKLHYVANRETFENVRLLKTVIILSQAGRDQYLDSGKELAYHMTLSAIVTILRVKHMATLNK